jgi:hypothetical protein
MANGQRLGAQAGQLGEVLQGLFKLTGSPVTQQLKQTQASNPINILGQLLGTLGGASVKPAEEELRQSAAGTTQRLEQMGVEAPDPLSDATLKEVLKIRKEQVREAAEQGAPLDDILRQAEAMKTPEGQLNPGQGLAPQPQGGQPQGGQQGQATQALTANQPQGAPQVSQEQGKNLLVGLFNALGFKESGASRLNNANADLAKQQLAGEQPLQKGEREKLENKQFNQLFTGASKPLSDAAAKTVGNINSGLRQLDALEQSFATDPGVFTTTGLSATGQAVRTMTEDLTDIIGRLRSGGAINKDEEKRFKGQLPAVGPIAGRIEKASTVKLKLQKLRALFSDIQSSVTPNAGQSQRVQAALNAGFSKEEIMSAFQQRGGI